MSVLQIDPQDNVWVALENLTKGQTVKLHHHEFEVMENIRAKHKIAITDLAIGDAILMYGTTVGKTTKPIRRGWGIHTDNIEHHTTQPIVNPTLSYDWSKPDISEFEDITFNGYHRADGKVGIRNFWLVIPLVFCENRNVEVLKQSLIQKLGYDHQQSIDIQPLIDALQSGDTSFNQIPLVHESGATSRPRVFPHVDGIKFLTHEGGCGGTRADSDMLCRLIATYIAHPNVGGATVLSLGCQNAQIKLLQEHLNKINSSLSKPVFYFEQQGTLSERSFLEKVLQRTFIGLTEINKTRRQPAPLHKLTLGLECGGSDGFSGLSANPALGYTSDLLVTLGGTAILAEFPELHGAEQNLVNRSISVPIAEKFLRLMHSYQERARRDGSGFEANPSPGNIRDGLITDAIKSLGAAKKGGDSPVKDVLDYGEISEVKGLNLLCTPGNDVESTTGLASAGASIIVFTTGLGTPTGNASAPTIKMSTNSDLYRRMTDIIDIDAGRIITGSETIQSIGKELLKLIIQVANGQQTSAERLGQDDFIPWKRGISL